MVNNLMKLGEMLKHRVFSRIVVMAGAGISTPSGLPDFRSPGSGLYDNLQKYNLPFPTAVFDIGYFARDPTPFFQVAKSLYPGEYPPTEAHWFCRLLSDKNLLLRMYTQNIDGLETLAGLPVANLVEAHGSFATASCQKCFMQYNSDEIKPVIFADRIPKCTKCQGIIKPNIVFFGEMLPERFMLHVVDLPLTDLLIVLGTSLEVQPFASISEYALPTVPRLLINKDVVGTFLYDPRPNDCVFQGDIVHGIRKLSEYAGWLEELDALKASYKATPLRQRSFNEE